MCIVISGETQPDTTKLMNIPVIIEDKKYNFFIYVNNFDLQTQKMNQMSDRLFMDFESNDNFSNFGNFGNFASFLPRDEFYKKNKLNSTSNSNNSIMVVPFPVEKGTLVSEIGLVDVSTESMKELRQSIKSLKPKKKSINESLGMSKSFSRNFSEPLEVHKIGNYNISVAKSMTDLLNRIDWSKFNKPADFEQRINTFKNPNLYPREYGYFYVVAEAIENIKDDGFGVVYPQLKKYFYIPTAHEDTASEHNFDVEIYNFGYGTDNINKTYYHQTLNKLKNQRVKMLNNSYKNMSYDKDISTFSFKEENGSMRNHNIWYHKN
jgi:hypothetical protein